MTDSMTKLESFHAKAEELAARRAMALAEAATISRQIGEALAGIGDGGDGKKLQARRQACLTEFGDLESALAALGGPWGEAVASHLSAERSRLQGDAVARGGEIGEARSRLAELKAEAQMVEARIADLEAECAELNRLTSDNAVLTSSAIRSWRGLLKDLISALAGDPLCNVNRASLAALLERWAQPIELPRVGLQTTNQTVFAHRVGVAWNASTGEVLAARVLSCRKPSGAETCEGSQVAWPSWPDFVERLQAEATATVGEGVGA